MFPAAAAAAAALTPDVFSPGVLRRTVCPFLNGLVDRRGFSGSLCRCRASGVHAPFLALALIEDHPSY